MACVSVLTALIFISCFKPRYLRLEAEQGYAAEQIPGFGQSERGQITEEQTEHRGHKTASRRAGNCC